MQSIIFQNRRGYAPVVICSQCGWTPKCEHCDVSLVYHKHIGELRCHYCGFSMTLPKVCPACGENALGTYGYGTERVADDLHNIYPSLRIARMDLDTTRNKNGHEEIIGKFSRHDTDVLVGTQMVSKGLDFEKVKLVGILNADTLLNFPDFRSDERAFNMMEQVAGRAGRHGAPGRVIIQTTAPKNEIIARVVNHDYTGYYDREVELRREFAYPPFTRVINIYLRHKDEHALIDLDGLDFLFLRLGRRGRFGRERQLRDGLLRRFGWVQGQLWHHVVTHIIFPPYSGFPPVPFRIF